MPANGPARTSLGKNGGIIVAASAREAIELANRSAPEHLVVESDQAASRIANAGAIFVGRWTAQVAGDYAIGSNHVLPTAGAGRIRGGLNAADFVKLVSVQRVSERGLKRLAGTVATLARAEGLEAHARSIEVRLASPGGGTRPARRRAISRAPGTKSEAPHRLRRHA